MVDHVALLNEKSESLTSEDLTLKIGRRDVRATGFFDHTKATERYVILVIGNGASSRSPRIARSFAEERVFISPVGCQGILRRAEERGVKMNARLKDVMERIASQLPADEIERISRIQPRGAHSRAFQGRKKGRSDA